MRNIIDPRTNSGFKYRKFYLGRLNSPQLLNLHFRFTNTTTHDDYHRVKRELDDAQHQLAKYRALFSETQNKIIVTGKRPQIWGDADISEAMALYLHGPGAYCHLREKNFPLPGPSTLRAYAFRLDVYPGILKPIIPILNDIGSQALDRYCMISFDEMKVDGSKTE